MCCGEIEIAQGYVLERASSKFHQLDTNFTVTVIYINFCCKNCVNNNAAKEVFRGILKSDVDISFQ